MFINLLSAKTTVYNFAEFNSRIFDEEGLLSLRDRESIDSQLASFAEESGFEYLNLTESPITGGDGNREFLLLMQSGKNIVVLTFQDITPYENAREFCHHTAVNFAENHPEFEGDIWLLLISSKHGLIHITATKDTERIISHAACRSIANELIAPEFKEKNFYNGILAGVQKLIEIHQK